MAEGAERAEPGDSEQDEEEDVYEVERIIDMRVEDGEILYRVRWKNYSSDDDTWEPKAHLEDCTEVLLAYERVLAERKSPKKDSGMLPMKSDLFNANSESDSDKDRPRESPVKKKKKKKHVEEDSEDEKPVKDKKKKKKKKEKWKEDKPLPAPESDEEEDKVSMPPSPKKEKTTDVKKRVIESDDEDDNDEDDRPSAAKKHKKDKPKDGGGKHKKESVEERKKKKVKSRKELESSEDETDKSDVPSESHTDDTTATDNLSSTPAKTVSPKPAERSSGVDHSKAKQKNKKTELKLQSFKDLVQEKKPRKSDRPAPVLKESGLSKLKSLTSSKSSSKSSRSEDDPDSGDTAATAKPKSKGKVQESTLNLAPQKDSLSSASSSSALVPSNKAREEETREEAGEKGGTPNNLFEKFLLTCEAKDRVPRKQAAHTTPKSSGKTDKKVKPTKESPVQSEKTKEDRLNVTLRPKRQCAARKVLDLLCNIDEMESEGEQSEVENDEREDESDSSFDPHSDSDSECEIKCAVDSTQEAGDGTVWVEQTAGEPWVGAWNVDFGALRETPGPTKYAADRITSPLSSLMCLFDEEMWETIRKHTQAEADRSDADKFKLTAEELKAFVALIYMRGITGGKTMKLDDYWSADLGNRIFLKTMTRQKFRDIMRYLRFDDKNTRAARLETDKFAMISELFYKFVRNCIASYTPGENITIDEQLFPTKARCRFTQYMVNKPDKFGIKFWVAVEAETRYVLNMFPYLGKEGSKLSGQEVRDSVVTRLVEPFLDKGRTITTANFFPSLALASHLLVNKTTIVGTVRKSRRETPRCTQSQSEIFNTKVLRTGNTTLTIYQAKLKENVCVLSTLHQTVSVDTGKRKVPDSVSHYNDNKFTVDVLDRMAHLYTVKSGTQRWPVAVFYNMLDLAAINAHILYKQCTKVKISRRKFIIELVKEICKVRQIAKADEELSRTVPVVLSMPVKRNQCQIGKCSKNNTFNMCENCRRFVCGKCSKRGPKLCVEC